MTAPEEICNVTASIFSVARFYGGCRAFGSHYVYDPTRDVLIREDILKKRAGEEKKAMKQKRAQAKAKRNAEQGNLFSTRENEDSVS